MNRIENPEINPHIYGHLKCATKEARICIGRTASLVSGAGEIGTATSEIVKLEHSLTPRAKGNTK